MGKAVEVLFKVLEIAIEEVVVFIKEKLNGGKNDSTRTTKTE